MTSSSSPLIKSTSISWKNNSSLNSNHNAANKHRYWRSAPYLNSWSSLPPHGLNLNNRRSSSSKNNIIGYCNISENSTKEQYNNLVQLIYSLSAEIMNGLTMKLHKLIIVTLFLGWSGIIPFIDMLPSDGYTMKHFAANAVLYSPDTKVLPRSGEFALRRAIPANAKMKSIQDSLEDISYLLRIPQRKPFGTMESDVKKAIKIATEEKEAILSSIPKDSQEEGLLLYNSLVNDKQGGLMKLIQFIKDNDADKVSVGLASSLETLAQIELLQAPGLSFLLPQQYLDYPRLTGRGAVEFTVEKGDGSTFFPTFGGQPQSLSTIKVVLDGYSAPLTTGNIAKLVLDEAYDGMTLKCTDQAILVNGKLKNPGYNVPLELMPSGQFEPLYRTPLSIQDGELPVLPLSVYGSVAMSHSTDSDEYSSPSQFFFYLYDKRNSGLGGLAFDEGQFSVFGYVTTGRDVLSQLKTGDIIRSAKLVEGQDRLILPSAKDS